MAKKIPIVILFSFFFLPLISVAQQSYYFPNRLIIKYESEQKLHDIQAKLKVDPRTSVQQILSQNGARSSQPLLPEKIRQTIRQRNLPSSNDIQRIREITFGRQINPVSLAAKINKMPGIEYAEPKYIRRLSYTPNDPQLEKYIDAHNFTEGWEISRGSSEVIIAIVDGGVGYTHTELDDKLWVNQGEIPSAIRPQVDQNGDGTVTSTEIKEYLQQNGDDYNGDGEITLEDALHENSSFTDGLDNDNNDFTDDLFGWDFWESGGEQDPIITDNNPIHDDDGTDHGTHVAGIAAAETDNDTAIAGAGFDTNYMAVKAGGTPDNSEAVGFGFEGIIYAAQNGADIINCSWGGGAASEAEQEVINLATEMGALVVAASGNESSSQVSYPAGYDKVVAVGAVEPGGTVAAYSNFGYQLDVLATGSDIQSTSYDNNLVSKSGTSMATPVVSGLAALLKEQHPGWSAERIGRQVRASATYIDNANSDDYENKLGHGSIDAFNALNTDKPGLKVVSRQFINEAGDKLEIDQPGTVEITLTNLGNATSGLTLQVESLNEEGLELSTSTQQLGTIATGDTVEVSIGMTITNSFNLSETPTLRLNYEEADYNDFGIVRYDDLLYDILAANNIKTSLAADGTIGFTDPLAGTGGVGFIPRTPDGPDSYQEGDNLLFEGGLIIEIDGNIHDAVRAGEGLSRDFIPKQVFATEPYSSGLIGSTRFVTDTDSARRAAIDLKAYALDEPALSNVIFLEYTISNLSSFTVMENVYAGLFNDWDLGSNPSQNNISFSEADSILYISDASQSSTQPLVAVAHLGPISGALAIDNTIEGQTDSLTFGLYDGFTDTEKSNALTSGTERTSVQNTDASAVTASGPYTLDPMAEVTVGFVYAFGDDLDQLRNQIAEARSRNLFPVSPTGKAVSDNVPQQTKLYQNYPNPFRENTRLRIDLQQSTNVTITIFDALGRKIRTVADEEFQAGSHFIRFTADRLSSGVYFVRLKTDRETQTIPMTLIK